MNFDIYAVGKTRNKSNKSRGHQSEKDCCFPEVEGQPINESEQQLPLRPDLLPDDCVVKDDHEEEEEAIYGGY